VIVQAIEVIKTILIVANGELFFRGNGEFSVDQSEFDFLHIYFYHPKNIEILTI
jgi:hypothetical protein